jgi:hypothetical protein
MSMFTLPPILSRRSIDSPLPVQSQGLHNPGRLPSTWNLGDESSVRTVTNLRVPFDNSSRCPPVRPNIPPKDSEREGRSVIRSQLNSYSGSDPIWGFVALLGHERFTGEAAVGLDPRVRLFAVDGRVYFAEREGDAPVSTRLVNCGAVTTTQLEHGASVSATPLLLHACSSASRASIATPSS